MARYKYIDTNPHFLSVDLARELLPGAFEHAVNHLLDHEVDLPHFDARFRNDATGASAYPPAMLLKVVLFAYSQGIVRSRAIERLGPGARDVHTRCAGRPPRTSPTSRTLSARCATTSAGVCGGAGGVRRAGADRAGDVCD